MRPRDSATQARMAENGDKTIDARPANRSPPGYSARDADANSAAMMTMKPSRAEPSRAIPARGPATWGPALARRSRSERPRARRPTRLHTNTRAAGRRVETRTNGFGSPRRRNAARSARIRARVRADATAPRPGRPRRWRTACAVRDREETVPSARRRMPPDGFSATGSIRSHAARREPRRFPWIVRRRRSRCRTSRTSSRRSVERPRRRR